MLSHAFGPGAPQARGPVRHRLRLAWVAMALLATRVPLLFGGYGSDDDAWRNIVAALHARDAGHYVPSRAPGFPLYEGLLTALAPGGSLVTNLAAVLAGIIALALFWGLLEDLKVRNREWVWTAFAFGSAMWVEISQTMDYSLGLACFLAAWRLVLRERYFLAGILIALATGCRATYLLLGAAFLVLMLWRRAGWKACAAYALGCGPLALALFVPYLLSPEARELLGDFRLHTGRHATLGNVIPWARVCVVWLIGHFGLLVIGSFALALLVGRARWPRGPRIAPQAEHAFELAVVAITISLFLLIPGEGIYLLPALPVVLIAMSRILPRGWLAAAAIAMVAESLVSISFEERRFVPGRLLLELETRRHDARDVRELLQRHPSTPTVFVVGRFMILRLWASDRALTHTERVWSPWYDPGISLTTPDGRVAFADRLRDDQAQELIARGWAIQRLEFRGN